MTTPAPAPASTEGQSTVDTRTMALTMFTGQVPCLFSMADPSCPRTATWLAIFAHEENTAADCQANEPMPVCDDHRQMIHHGYIPFWRVWYNLPAAHCAGCDTPLRLDRFEAL